jgi:hypothetical protein
VIVAVAEPGIVLDSTINGILFSTKLIIGVAFPPLLLVITKEALREALTGDVV